MNWKRNEGLTLVELMVAILVAAIITTAATTIMLLGLRVNRHSTNTAQTQYTARTVLTVLENLASEGNAATVEAISVDMTQVQDEENTNGWKIIDSDENVLISYSEKLGAIFVGEATPDNKPLFEGLTHAAATFDGGLLTFVLETGNSTYTSSVYCRAVAHANQKDDTNSSILESEKLTSDDSRAAFLRALISQYGSVGGVIQYVTDGSIVYDLTEKETYRFFSEWYIDGYDSSDVEKGWNYRTPWCACFISWGLSHYKAPNNNPIAPLESFPHWFASVETFKTYYFTGLNSPGTWRDQTDTDINPGDLIFFDWEKGQEPVEVDHIGAVLKFQDEVQDNGLTVTFVYTIEGNSDNMVAIRKYPIDDSRIYGYGVLPWPTDNSE